MPEQRPKVDFADGVQVDLKVKFSEAMKSGEGKFGPWWLWTVEDFDGSDASLFADADLQNLLEAAELERGDELSIKPMGKGASRTWHVWCNSQAVSLTGAAQEAEPAPQQDKPAQQAEAPPEASKRPSDATYHELVNLLGACVSDAALIWEERQKDAGVEWDARAVQALASTLFIEARKCKVQAPDYSEPSGVEGYVTPPTVEHPLTEGGAALIGLATGDPGPTERDDIEFP
jgi:hypothetical protein